MIFKKNIRLDQYLVENSLATTRSRAQAMIIAGNVLVDDVPVTKTGTLIKVDSIVRLKEPEIKYVSRGAFKLIAALDYYKINVDGKIAIDVGASTGGFSEVLLERNIKKVVALDVGTNQLDWKIRSNPKVLAIDHYNARNIKKNDFKELFDVAVMDVSFISVSLILPALMSVLNEKAIVVILFKPQFEVGKEWVGKGGIVHNHEQVMEVLDRSVRFYQDLGLNLIGTIPSPIKGTDGNQEYLVVLSRP